MRRERLKLNMSSLTALFTVRKYMNETGFAFENSQHYLKKADPTWAHLDWEGAQAWEQTLDSTPQNDLIALCRKACLEFILSDVVFINLGTYGREKLIANLSDDEIQVFRNARLLDKVPDDQTVLWWDEIKLIGRKNLNDNLLIQGRQAEKWTLQEELKITSKWGKNYVPSWIAIEGDNYGYDILSYRMSENGLLTTILIEVKSFSKLNNPHFYLYRNEWEKALLNPSKYLFYVWCIENQTFKIFTVENVDGHIPLDRNLGTWENVLITF